MVHVVRIEDQWKGKTSSKGEKRNHICVIMLIHCSRTSITIIHIFTIHQKIVERMRENVLFNHLFLWFEWKFRCDVECRPLL